MNPFEMEKVGPDRPLPCWVMTPEQEAAAAAAAPKKISGRRWAKAQARKQEQLESGDRRRTRRHGWAEQY